MPVRVRLLAAVLAALILLPGPALGQVRPTQVPTAMPSIDVHDHLRGDLGPRSRGASDFPGAADAALAAMDRLGVRTMIVMPPPFTENHPAVFDCEELLPVARKRPDRFGVLCGGGSLNAMIQEAVRQGETTPALAAAFEKRARSIPAMGALGFGELGAEHFSLGPKHNHHAAPPDHPLFLLLADVAASADVPIDIHMEAAPEDLPLPGRLASPPNPRTVPANIPAFERLLSHNPRARIIWSHAGWDNVGARDVALMRRLLRAHPNLFMSVKISPRDSLAANSPVSADGSVKPEWLRLFEEFPDRFMIGADQFFHSPKTPGQTGPTRTEPAQAFLRRLPPELARQIGLENPRRTFKLP